MTDFADLDPAAANAADGQQTTPAPQSKEDQQSVLATILQNRAGFVVMIGAGVTVGVIIAVLAMQVFMGEYKYRLEPPSSYAITQCSDAACARDAMLMSLESDAQRLRTDRVRTSVLSRLFVFMVSEVAGFSIAVMGAVLIFNRVTASTPELLGLQLRITNGASGAVEDGPPSGLFSVKSMFPGVVLCAIGGLLIGGTVFLSTWNSTLFSVSDVPVFLPDSNALRNSLGVVSAMRPSLNGTAATTPLPMSTDSDRPPWETSKNKESQK